MRLRTGARRFAHFAWRGAPVDAADPDVQVGGAWVPMEWWDGQGQAWDDVLSDLGVAPSEVASGAVRISRVLLAHPAAPPGGGTVVASGRVIPLVRLDPGDGGEIIIEPATVSITVD